jgi:hypothetical protein
MPTPELIERFRTGSHRLDPRLLQLSDEQLDRPFDPALRAGAWSCRTVIGHIADADLVYVHRLRRTVAEDRPVLAVFDEHAFIDSGLYAPAPKGAPSVAHTEVGKSPAGFVAVIHTLRLWTGQWLATLTPQQFARTALHPQSGEVSVRRFLEIGAWHLEHHGWFLSAKLDHLLGPVRNEAVPAGGCGPACRCVGTDATT